MMTPRLYKDREWRWWLVYNDHSCRLCHAPLGKLTNMRQVEKGYWHRLFQIWQRHIKEHHPELLKEAT